MKVKIINTHDKPFEFSFDSIPFGPYAPGEIVELDANIAEHGIKRSWIRDNEGMPVRKRLEYLADVQKDPTRLGALPQVYHCPFGDRGCSSRPFKSIDELKAHLEESHWPRDDDFDELNQTEPSARQTKKEKLGITLRG